MYIVAEIGHQTSYEERVVPDRYSMGKSLYVGPNLEIAEEIARVAAAKDGSKIYSILTVKSEVSLDVKAATKIKEIP